MTTNATTPRKTVPLLTGSIKAHKGWFVGWDYQRFGLQTVNKLGLSPGRSTMELRLKEAWTGVTLLLLVGICQMQLCKWQGTIPHTLAMHATFVCLWPGFSTQDKANRRTAADNHMAVWLPINTSPLCPPCPPHAHPPLAKTFCPAYLFLGIESLSFSACLFPHYLTTFAAVRQ